MKSKAGEYDRIVVLTGAGISAESGLRTFRGSDGLWEGHKVEDVATPEAFASNPRLVQDFYNARRRQLLEVKPNTAHFALANFEANFSGEFLLVTQNVDNLHERAGSTSLRHMHGELCQARCIECGETSMIKTDIEESSQCPHCHARALRPHIVWFGEMPLFMDEIIHQVQACSLFVSIGTSGNVYPAAGFVETAKMAGADTLELNLEHTGNPLFDQSLLGSAGELVPKFFTV
jgi:NAD-dependent deacetylase